jgi:DNA polymerase I-like protein with 3'-5' exonuclease and polymerase domains
LNFTIQSAASDILLCSLLGASRRFKQAGLKARPVATVHDSIEVICPEDEVKKTLTILYDEMVNYPTIRDIFKINFNVPLVIEAEVGKSFGEGEPVHFENGVPKL